MYKCLFEAGDVPRNLISPPIPHVPRIPFPIPVLLNLYKAFNMFSKSKLKLR